MPNLLQSTMPPTTCMFPAINLRMKSVTSRLPRGSAAARATVNQELVKDQLNVMAKQDLTQCNRLGPNFHRLVQDHAQALDMEVARKRMIDWQFRVVDHYGISRDAVAASTSLLDYYVSSCHREWYDCDKSTFKLAAMTTLYMAAKVQDQTRLLSVTKLVELSRGEFHEEDIVNMETRILAQLGWRVHPVTVHSFIHSFLRFVRNDNTMIMNALYDRAIFFAELCLFDQRYATSSRAFLAAAAVLNALEGIGESQACEQAFLDALQAQTDIDFRPFPSLDQVREDLWYIYSLSTQYHEDDLSLSAVSPSSSPSTVCNGTSREQAKTGIHHHHHTHSPTTVQS